MTQTGVGAEALVTGRPPIRLHHNAYVTNDLGATREFYEDVIGMPLVATWAEVAELDGKTLVYCHCFFGLQDGSALAFFQFADPDISGITVLNLPRRRSVTSRWPPTNAPRMKSRTASKRRGSRRPVPSESTTATACRSTLSIPTDCSWSSRSTRRRPTSLMPPNSPRLTTTSRAGSAAITHPRTTIGTDL